MQNDMNDSRTNGHESTEGVPLHTPLPWKVEGPAFAIISTSEIKGGRFHVADMRGWGHLTGKGHGALGLDEASAIAIQEANAALIVRAVNSHDALAASLKEMMDVYWGAGDGQLPEPACIQRARSALAVARDCEASGAAKTCNSYLERALKAESEALQIRDRTIEECATSAHHAFEAAMDDYVLMGPSGMAMKMINAVKNPSGARTP